MYTTSTHKEFSFLKRMKSFQFAFNGIISFFRAEHNAWIHLFASFIVLFLVLIIPCTGSEIIMLVFAIAFVWVTEMINTVIERIADLICKEQNAQIKLIKDVSAGAVLIATFFALATGSIIFIPKIF